MLEHAKIVLLALVFLGSAGPAYGQTLAREYIHLGGRIIAVENAPTQPGMTNLILGGPSVTAATTEAGSSLTFTFSATAGQQASFSFTQNSSTGGNWISGTITKPDGSTLMSNMLAPGIEVTTQEVPGGKTSRELAEQQKINSLGGTKSQPGSQTSNIRNPVSPQRLKKLDGSDQ